MCIKGERYSQMPLKLFFPKREVADFNPKRARFILN